MKNAVDNRRKLMKQFRNLIAQGGRTARRAERLLNAEIPGTRSRASRALGPRVAYIVVPGRGKNREVLSARAAEVMRFVARRKRATSQMIQAGLKVNRNVIAGAVHELKSAGLVKSQAIKG